MRGVFVEAARCCEPDVCLRCVCYWQMFQLLSTIPDYCSSSGETCVCVLEP